MSPPFIFAILVIGATLVPQQVGAVPPPSVEAEETTLPPDDPKTCGGGVKPIVDLAAEFATTVPDVGDGRRSGRIGNGSLSYGWFWLKSDISLLYSRLGCWQSAREMADRIGPANLPEITKAELSVAYAKAGHFRPAIVLLGSLKTEEAFSRSAYGIAEALVAAGLIEQAKETIMRVTTRWHYLESPSFGLIQALIEVGRLDDAERMMGEVRHVWNEHLLIAEAHFKAGNRKRAEFHLRSAAETAGRGVDAISHVNGWIAALYIDNKMFGKARKTAAHIPRLMGRIQVFLRLAEALRHAGRMEQSGEAFAEAIRIMLRIKKEQDSSNFGTACRFVAESYARIGEATKAGRVISGYCPRSRGIYVVVRELAKQGDVEGARRLQAKLDGKSQNDLDGPIAAAMARKGDYEAAAVKGRGIVNEAIRFSVVRSLASSNPPSTLVEKWLEDTGSFKHEDIRAAAVQTLTAALARSNGVPAAISWLKPLPPDLAKVRGYLGIAQGMLGIVPGGDAAGD